MTPIPQCVVCKIKLQNPEQYLFQCSNCHRKYILDYEVLAYEDSVGTAYDDEAATIETEGLAAGTGPRLEIIEGELDSFPSLDEQMEKEYGNREGNIPRPKYLQDSETTTVKDYKEEQK